MRDYGKVAPAFWTGKTGKALRGHAEAQIVALYLMTSPHSTMIGVFHLPVLYIGHETGLGIEGATKGLQRCIEGGFCTYDEETETVFVVEMAAHQIGGELVKGDNRIKSIAKQYATIAQTVVGQAFYARYGRDFDLQKPDKSASPSEAPCKPLPSQKQEQEQKKEQKEEAAPVGVDILFEGVDPQVIADFRKLRRDKKAAITQTAVDGIRREATKAGLTLQAAMAMCCERGWTGFKADWVTGAGQSAVAATPGGGRRAL